MNRQEIARFALEETQKHSFEKVSMQSLAEHFGVKKASFYYHFPSKDALAVAVIEEARQMLISYFQRFVDRSASFQLNAYIRVFSKHMNPTENLCPGAGFIATWPNQSVDVKQAVSELYQTHQTQLVKIIDKGKAQGEFTTTEDAASAAQSIFSLLQGGLLTARVTNSTKIFDSARASIIALLGGSTK